MSLRWGASASIRWPRTQGLPALEPAHCTNDSVTSWEGRAEPVQQTTDALPSGNDSFALAEIPGRLRNLHTVSPLAILRMAESDAS